MEGVYWGEGVWKKGDIKGKGDVEGRRNGKRKGDVEGRGDVKREMLKGRGCRQYIENERGWTDLVAGHGFRVLICRPPIRVSLSLHVVLAVHRWWCWGLRCRLSVVCGALFTICRQCGALIAVCQWWPPVPFIVDGVVVWGSMLWFKGGGGGCSLPWGWWLVGLEGARHPWLFNDGGVVGARHCGGGVARCLRWWWALIACCCLRWWWALVTRCCLRWWWWWVMGCCGLLWFACHVVVLGGCRLSWVGGHRCWWMIVVVDLVPHSGVLASWMSSSSLSEKSLSMWHTPLNCMCATSVIWWWRRVLFLHYCCHYCCRHCRCWCL